MPTKGRLLNRRVLTQAVIQVQRQEKTKTKISALKLARDMCSLREKITRVESMDCKTKLGLGLYLAPI